MLANFLDKSKPIIFIGLLIFFGINFCIVTYFTFFKEIFVVSAFTEVLLFLLLLLSSFFFYNFIRTKNKLTLDNSYGYFVFTLFVICLLRDLFDVKKLSIFLIYILFLRKIYSLRSQKNVLQKLFDCGFWFGILFILEPETIIFLPLIYLGIYLHQKITFHTLFAPIIGFLTPVIIYFTYLFWFDNTETLLNKMVFSVHLDAPFFLQEKYNWFFNFILAISLLAISIKSIKTFTINNTFRKNWILIITNFVLAILILLFTDNKTGYFMIFILFPASIIIANGMEMIKKKLLRNIILYLFLVVSIYFSFFL
ncbi:DUF6427 family protein [Polaribacter porphyrae]|uniref:Beta-carotene 15,15'-monooxygenase n=1 Tax=Polaribacter porphyrae TaxID=1137780 RepID=A0A2S7WQS8_9FLAO|nr:DUF6427 family protein [Polaribacter porphyrae]PQJ79943.1 hypothetical protein BTO18_12520 [Polaribacter porphyrae]